MTTPSITVLMPVYNAAPYLRESIDSVLSQTFTDFEFLIINDGSTDQSEEIILSYSDKRIRYFKNPINLKLIQTLNKGFGLALGKYLVRADADDINYPNRLALQFAFMEQHPDVALSGTGFETFGTDIPTQVTRYAPDHNTICFKHLYQIHLSHGTSIFRMSEVKKHSLFFDPSYEHAEDYELWTRISSVSKLANIPDVLYRVRQHDTKVSKLFSQVQELNSLRVKKNLFEKMGANLHDKDVVLFGSIAQHEYLITKDFLISSKLLLTNVLVANNSTSFFSRNYFNEQIGMLWFNVANNCTSLGLFSFIQFFKSSLHSYASVSLGEKIKFFIKAVIKK